MNKISFTKSPFHKITIGYLVLSLLFAFLYWLPPLHYGELSFVDAWFISSSGLSTTGLSTVVLSDVLTPAAQWLMILEMQIGGIGFMGIIGFYLFLMHRDASLPQLTLMGFDQNQRSLRNIKSLVIFIALFSAVSEFVGFLFLIPDVLRFEGDVETALRYTAFHAVSAFTNSGLDLFGGSVAPFNYAPMFMLVTALLVFLGVLGFPTVWELLYLRGKKKSLYTKVNLLFHAVLLVSGTILITALEWSNRGTVGEMPYGFRLLNTFFISVSSRSGGLGNVDFTFAAPATVLLLMVLMFIGGSASSTAGGIRITTFAILLAKARSAITRNSDVILFRKSLYEEDVQKAYIVFFFVLSFFFLSCFVLFISEDALDVLAVTFEGMSAITNNGFSFGITGELSTFGKLWITLMMMVGRIGIISIIYSVVKPRKSAVKYIKESIIVG
ncbi:TrkH family potassium uptake protein [Paenibacillus sp.]|uniref:TrkH family potassium uptake protein n=1 Tax=Paenibacillus sp. TaxID=58172 RepID=UPI002D5FAD8F|nr:potassium transporter TrkG [Paenibacillus sp.]HZG56557.1 potassium transporter TrkG [Paenibacillus sp.]